MRESFRNLGNEQAHCFMGQRWRRVLWFNATWPWNYIQSSSLFLVFKYSQFVAKQNRIALGFGESSDGTGSPKIYLWGTSHNTCRCTFLCTRSKMTLIHLPGLAVFGSSRLKPALDHTAKTEFEGTKHLASRIADRIFVMQSLGPISIRFVALVEQCSCFRS